MSSHSQIRRGHSHNDYHQTEPVISALKHGFSSIEVDVFPFGENLLVGHTWYEAMKRRNVVDDLYIQPLLSIVRRRKRRISELLEVNKNSADSISDGIRESRRKKVDFPLGEGLTLLVDFKSDPDTSATLLYRALDPLLPHLTYSNSDTGEIRKGPITVLISGNRPHPDSLVNSEGKRYLFIDGRANDIKENSDSTLVPMVSMSWFTMQLSRITSGSEKNVKTLIDQAHRQGKLFRIWGAPNTEKSWRTLLRSKVDILGIDDHKKFAAFASKIHRV